MRKIAGSMLIPADEIVKSDTEIAEAEAAEQQMLAEQNAAGGAPQADPELEGEKLAVMREKMANEAAIAEMNVARDRYVADRRYDAEMHKVAEMLNMSMDEMNAKLAMHREDKASKERIFAGEAAMTMRRDAQADLHAEKDRDVKIASGAAKAKDKTAMPKTGGGYI
jgi:hypothetical protein